MATLRAWLTNIGRSAQNRVAMPFRSVRDTSTSSGVVGIPSTARRPIGGLRGALTGFAVGFGAASSYGYIYLLKEYHEASSAMVASVQELQESTMKVTEAFSKVSALEEQTKSLAMRSSSKEEMLRRNKDLVRVYDGLHEDVLEVRRKLYDIEQDLNWTLGTPGRQANTRIV